MWTQDLKKTILEMFYYHKTLHLTDETNWSNLTKLKELTVEALTREANGILKEEV